MDPSTANMIAISIDGEQHYVCVMSPFQEHDLRISDAGGWLDIQKAAAQAEGRNNPIFKGGLGMIDNVVLHSHESVIRFSDYGAGSNVLAARALFMGRQAGVCAYGSAGGLRFTWTEEMADHGNEPKVAAGVIMGVKKTRFNGKDFGILSIDTAAKDPNP
jgi:N4-gp56 family major capsid protein